ncbi:MAG: hypothetical protein MUC60_09340 [Oscillatoria sp. Prado101]|nr:hypothetical protein [Oscillatoria sp. Prado101]
MEGSIENECAVFFVTKAIRLQPVSGVSCQVAVPAAHAGILVKVSPSTCPP